MSVYYGTEGYLLSWYPLGEADRRLIFYTKDLGKVEVLAKSVRRAESKLKGHLNLFVRARLVLTPGKGYWRLADAESSISHNRDPDISSLKASADFLLELLVDREPSEVLWLLVENFCDINSSNILRFKARVLGSLGLLPGGQELELFFGREGAAYIRDEADESTIDPKMFEGGIRKILALNHF